MSPPAVLTPEKCRRIHAAMAEDGLTYRAAAVRFGVSASVVGRVVRGEYRCSRRALTADEVFEVLCCLQDGDAEEVAARFGVGVSAIDRHWDGETAISQTVWEAREGEIRAEWTRRGAPEWRAA